MQYRNTADLDRFMAATAVMMTVVQDHQEVVSGLAGAAVTAEAMGVSALDPSDAIAALLQRLNAAFEPYEAAAFRLLGERRRAGESPSDFAVRVGSMEIRPTMKRNGLVLVP
jgi:hypothetical protein